MSDSRLASPHMLYSRNPAATTPMFHMQGALTGRSATVWPTASLGIFVPVPVNGPFTIRKLACENGVAASGNLDIGIYTREGNLVISTGSTAMSGVTWQVIDVTDTEIPPGLYYLALVINNTTGGNSRSAYSIQNIRSTGSFQMASAFPLPATATRTAVANSYYPSIMAMGVTTL